MNLTESLAHSTGVFTTQDAHARGYDGRSIARAVHRGDWHRVRRGAFVAAGTWAAATPEDKHLILAAAVHRSYGESVAFSHVTATLLHGVATWGVDLSRVHVTRLDGAAGRSERDVVHHEGVCLADDDVVQARGCLATRPARAALETGILGTTESSVVTLDSLFNLGLGTPVEVGNVYDVLRHWPGSQHLQVAVRMADGRAESVGESRARWLFFDQGLPAPELQLEVRDERGRLIGITDFAWPGHRTLGEFDGMVKYQRLLKPGQRPDQVVTDEKRREDALRRATRYGMVRLVWWDLEHPKATARWVGRYLAQS